jgi:mono/diheme cytochrome c family protein
MRSSYSVQLLDPGIRSRIVEVIHIVRKQWRRVPGMRVSPCVKGFWGVAFLMAGTALAAMLAPEHNVLAASGGRIAPVSQAVEPATGAKASDPGAASYAAHCAVCHGDERQGMLPSVPPLAGIKHQMTDEQITAMIRNGKGLMPSFQKMPDAELAGLLQFLSTAPAPPVPAANARARRRGPQLSPEAAAGSALFQQNCAFCHGHDAMGGETGPDLTRSKLVLSDTDGSKIAEVVREGRTSNDTRMPAFQFSAPEIASLVAFIRASVAEAAKMKGGRRGVDVSDLQTGNADAGKMYFNGAGGCAKCHSATGDLAGIASRYQGLQLEERMLYPRGAKSTVTVTLPSGQTVTGVVAYRDEFTIALKDSSGTYRSWPVADVRYKVDSPADAHVELFSRYTDDDIHNLMAYLQTLR